MRMQRRIALLLLAGGVFVAPAMRASSVSLGNTASGLTNDSVVDPITLGGVQAGQPAPFDQPYGDTLFTNFSATWALTGYGTPSVTGATLAIGIWNNDSGNFSGSTTHGSEVALFTVGGVDLTTDLNTLFDSHGGQLNEYSVYTLTLPSSTYGALDSGTVTIVLDLQGPGWADSLDCSVDPCVIGGPVDTGTVGAALVFSTLDMTTGGGVTTVPEPASFLLAGGAMAALALMRRRKRLPAKNA